MTVWTRTIVAASNHRQEGAMTLYHDAVAFNQRERVESLASRSIRASIDSRDHFDPASPVDLHPSRK